MQVEPFMQGVKPWQIALIAAALLGLGTSIVYSCSSLSSPVTQAKYANMVDVNTGELYQDEYPENHPVSYPQKKPGTTSPCLYPVYHTPEGKWMLDRRYLSQIRSSKDLTPEAIVDWKSGEVKVVNTKPTKAEIFRRS